MTTYTPDPPPEFCPANPMILREDCVLCRGFSEGLNRPQPDTTTTTFTTDPEPPTRDDVQAYLDRALAAERRALVALALSLLGLVLQACRLFV